MDEVTEFNSRLESNEIGRKGVFHPHIPAEERSRQGEKFLSWFLRPGMPEVWKSSAQLADEFKQSRGIRAVTSLDFGELLTPIADFVFSAIKSNKRIALYADYDVDGTMSAVSWAWFLRSISYNNFLIYIPDRMTEGYGVNLAAIKKLIHENSAEVIITMDTGITANEEALYCKAQNVAFICTDHHKIQASKMPDCMILNPKLHPDPEFQELCGCGITFVLLRQLGRLLGAPDGIWPDLLALTGLATICDVVPLRAVNHRLAKMGIECLTRSKREVFRALKREASAADRQMDESDIGFRIGPRINAVGRLSHANLVLDAFLAEDPEPLVRRMSTVNDQRKGIQERIVAEALLQAELYHDDPLLLLGGDWHPGVVGIAASKIAETFWKPTWLFSKSGEVCKGSARSIRGFDVTDAMLECGHLFTKFGGHAAAGGFSFLPENEQAIREALLQFADKKKQDNPELWNSSILYDGEIPESMLNLDTLEALSSLRPFGAEFEAPVFLVNVTVANIRYFRDKETQIEKHTCIILRPLKSEEVKLMFFNEVIKDLKQKEKASFLVRLAKNTYQGRTDLQLMGVDYASNSH